LSSASQSSCSGRSDFEVQPVISAFGLLSVTMNAPNGGLRDMGSASSLPDPSTVTGGTLSSQGVFQQGHVYLVKSGSNVSLVRVIRVNSSINPKMGATVSGQPAASASATSGSAPSATKTPAVRNSSGSLTEMMGNIHDQQTATQVMKSARIMIDLEWIPVQTQTVTGGGMD